MFSKKGENSFLYPKNWRASRSPGMLLWALVAEHSGIKSATGIEDPSVNPAKV
jgi:hypothetical protein